jgi:hypothetical protein
MGKTLWLSCNQSNGLKILFWPQYVENRLGKRARESGEIDYLKFSGKIASRDRKKLIN